jgi:hypothetical protein
MSETEKSTVRSRVAFFEQIQQGTPGDSSSCSKRAREVQDIISPGLVRDAKGQLLSPKEKLAAADQACAVHVVDGKVRETITSLSRSALNICVIQSQQSS